MPLPASEDEAFSATTAPAIDADAAPRALRRYFARHNRQALFLALLSLGASALLWAFIYAVVFWLTLVVLTISRSLNQATLLQVNDRHLISVHFPWWFAVGACLTLVTAAVVRQRVRVARLREARLYLLWVIVELFMAVPNVTFSIWGNLLALTRLRRREAAKAWQLLARIHQEGGRMNLANVRQEIDDENTLRHVMCGLQLVGLIGLRENEHGWYLYLQNRDAFAALLSDAQGVS